MGKKVINWKTKGMNQDLSVSAFNPDFSFENMNLRLSTNEGNTLMSWVNEKGTKEITLVSVDDSLTFIDDTIKGIVIGTAVLNHILVLFTVDEEDKNKPNYIYKVAVKEGVFLLGELYHGNLNMDVEHPLETHVSYEAEHILKVYWVDGKNQSRMINIAATPKQQDKWGDTSFDFIPTFKHPSSFTVVNTPNAGGLFAPGVIQYCFSYSNTYGQLSNIVDFSPLYYLSYPERGASPKDKVSNSLKISITGLDKSFESIRLYSVLRTSIDDVPLVKLLDVIPIPYTSSNEDSADIVYVDNGTTGSTMDPTELLYIGGIEIHPLTMIDKDQTLFLGNILMPANIVLNVQNAFNLDRENKNPNSLISFNYKDSFLSSIVSRDIYNHVNQIATKNQEEITTFKGGETYRFGIQLQTETGEWSNPIYIDDIKNTLYPKTTIQGVTLLVKASANINFETILSGSSDSTNLPKEKLEELEKFFKKYKKVRPLVVFPNIGEREVLCLGVLNPTVFNVEGRVNKAPFALASWFFRPYMINTKESHITVEVPESKIESGEDLKLDEFFNNNPNLTFEVFILVVNTTETVINDLKTTKKLGYKSSYIDLDHYIKLDNYSTFNIIGIIECNNSGVISIEDESYSKNSKIHQYILISELEWSLEKTEDSLHGHGLWTGQYAPLIQEGEIFDVKYPPKIEEGSSYVLPRTPFVMGEGMRFTDRLQPYYQKITYEGAPSLFTFKFSIVLNGSEPRFFKILYENVEENSVAQDTNTEGYPLAFNHYETLVTQNLKDVYKSEIQGAVATYSDVFDTTVNDLSNKSNTLFFVDLSIVTLNSPDIEFDTDVQNSSLNNYKLRIIGLIPITANSSYHKIFTKSSMLESYHNNSGGIRLFGIGDLGTNVTHFNLDINAGNRLVTEYLWLDALVEADASLEGDDDKIKTENLVNFAVYPWQRKGSLNNDFRGEDKASSLLSTKKISHLLYSTNTKYLSEGNNIVEYADISAASILTENAEVFNYRLNPQKDTASYINYYPNIDTILYNEKGYPILYDVWESTGTINTPIEMKYKSTSHIVIALNGFEVDGIAEEHIPIRIPILPYGIYYSSNKSLPNKETVDSFKETEALEKVGYYGNANYDKTFWGDTKIIFNDRLFVRLNYTKNLIGNSFDYLSDTNFSPNLYNYLWVGELYKEVDNKFGGKTEGALRNNTWIVAGESVDINEKGDTSIVWNKGDTYYQRYDCLKTYPYTTEDSNQLVEILSFMCETRVNIDGRYDKNRGQVDNTVMSPQNFNQVNPIYSLQDNFFSNTIVKNILDIAKYPNQITFTKTKNSGADVDLWTNITLANVLELDGDKGEIRSLLRFNDLIICFQDRGISLILYNENVQISSTEGVPIEIANSGKVLGKRYLSNTIGCSNKWSIANSPNGIYFIDSIGKNIFLFNDGLNNLSTSLGFNTWAKKNINLTENGWNPSDFGDFRTIYDNKNQEVMFINLDTALAYNEKLGTFTSFYNYEGTPWFCNFEDMGIWVKPISYIVKEGEPPKEVEHHIILWQHQKGEYGKFFGSTKPYYTILVGNQDSTLDKIFTNLEFRASVEGEGVFNSTTNKFTPSLPVDSLEVWNEYLHGIAYLKNLPGYKLYQHFSDSNDASLKRKFRIWRCDIPRDNCEVNALEENKRGIFRFKKHANDRIRNPWVYIKLLKNEEDNLPRTEIHDIAMTYFT